MSEREIDARVQRLLLVNFTDFPVCVIVVVVILLRMSSHRLNSLQTIDLFFYPPFSLPFSVFSSYLSEQRQRKELFVGLVQLESEA